MKNSKALYITQAAMVAALYVVLTLIANAFGLANHAIQVRFSEALTILPAFIPAAIPGLFVGCIISNLITGCMVLDIVFGSIATLIGALGTYFLSYQFYKSAGNSSFNVKKWVAPLPPIISNMIIVPLVLMNVYKFEGSFPYFAMTVGIGEIISCGVLGMFLLSVLERYRGVIFKQD